MTRARKLSFRHYFAFALLCAIWGSTWMAIKVVVHDVPPFRAAAERFLLAAILLALVAVAQKARLPRNSREWRAVLVLSITMMALPYGLIFWAEQHVSSSITAVLYSSSPLVAALLTPWMTGKSVPRAAILSLLVAVGGIAILFQAELVASPEMLLGGIGVLIGVVSSSWSTVYAKREAHEVDPIVSTGLQLFVGGAILAVFSLVLERGQPSEWRTSSVLALLFLAVFGSAVAFAFYYWLLRHMDAYKATTINLIVPFVAIIEGGVILHEMITPRMLVSAVIVLGSVAVALKAQRDEHSQLNLSRVVAEEIEP
jgi:drug/metabolite transporter (DMT)-like permease